MARAHRYADLTAVLVPAIAVLTAGVWTSGAGLRRFELDLSHDFIVALEHVGLALHVVRIPAERQLTARAMNPGGRQSGEDAAAPAARAAAIGREQPHRRP